MHFFNFGSVRLDAVRKEQLNLFHVDRILKERADASRSLLADAVDRTKFLFAELNEFFYAPCSLCQNFRGFRSDVGNAERHDKTGKRTLARGVDTL